jgi:hypothetical protein
MLDFSLDTWKVLSEIAKCLKYVCGGAATASSAFKLRYEMTIKRNDPTQRMKLTKAGNFFRWGILALAAATIFVAGAEDYFDARVTDKTEKEHIHELDVANEKLNQAIQGKLDAQLEEQVKRILEPLTTEVKETSDKLNNDLTEKSRKSTSAIEAQEQTVQNGIKDSAAEIGSLETSLSETESRVSSTLLEMQQAASEADLRVSEFWIEFSIGPSDDDTPQSGEKRISLDQLQAATQRICSFANTPGFAGFDQTCDFGKKQIAIWPIAHPFAERLFADKSLITAFSLSLNGLFISLVVSDCGVALQAAVPIPCLLDPAGITTYVRSDNGSGSVRAVPFRLFSGDHDKKSGLSMRYSPLLNSDPADPFRTKQLYASDLLVRTPLLITACTIGESLPISQAQIQKEERTLPRIITLTVDEKENHEAADKNTNTHHEPAFVSWVTHSYKLYRIEEATRSFCVEARYAQ